MANARLAVYAPSVFTPFAAFAALQCALLVLLAFFTAPSLAPFMVPVVRWIGGEAALHYPMHFVGLPLAYQRVYLPLAATVGFAAWTWGVWVMVDHHVVGRTRPRPSFRALLGQVVVVGIAFVGVSVAIGFGFGAATARMKNPLAGQVALVAGIALTACVQTFMVYAPVVLRLRGCSALRALHASAGYARRHFGPTVLVVATVLLAHLPFDLMLERADAIAARFRPELVFHLMVASALLEMFTAYLLFAATTELALPEEGGIR